MTRAKEIVIISGKGGTGKTTVTASLAARLSGIVIADADVDAANLHLLMKPELIRQEDFMGKPIANIDRDLCSGCHRCVDLCRFQAIKNTGGYCRVDPWVCDGCGLCRLACPSGAIGMNEREAGQMFVSETAYGGFLHARLIPGAENSGELVTRVKQEAREMARERKLDLVLTDGPPGIGCPVISAISGAKLAIIVSEPTYSAIQDLERVIELTRHFKIKSGIVINRYDINPQNTERLYSYAGERGIPVIAWIPLSSCILDEISAARLPYGRCSCLDQPVEQIVEYIKQEN